MSAAEHVRQEGYVFFPGHGVTQSVELLRADDTGVDLDVACGRTALASSLDGGDIGAAEYFPTGTDVAGPFAVQCLKSGKFPVEQRPHMGGSVRQSFDSREARCPRVSTEGWGPKVSVMPVKTRPAQWLG